MCCQVLGNKTSNLRRFGNNNFSCFGAKQGFGFRRKRDANAEAKHYYNNGNNIELHGSPDASYLFGKDGTPSDVNHNTAKEW